MIRVSKRYASALAALGLLAAIAVWIHHRGALDRDDCADPDRLAALLGVPEAGARAADAAGGPGTLQRIEGSIDWSDRPTLPLAFAVVRSTDPAPLTGRPFRPVLKELEATHRELRSVKMDDGTDGALPVHWTYGSIGREARFAAYVFVYDGRPVRRPTLALVAAAPARLLGGARPLTLLVAGGRVATRDTEASRAAAEAWLREAWRSYRRACVAPLSQAARRRVASRRQLASLEPRADGGIGARPSSRKARGTRPALTRGGAMREKEAQPSRTRESADVRRDSQLREDRHRSV